MMNLIEEISVALRRLPRALVALLIVVVASLGLTAVFRVVDAALVLPLPSTSQQPVVLAILVSRTTESTARGHLHLQARVKELEEPAAFSMLAELSVEGPSGVLSLTGAWPTRISDCGVSAEVEQRSAA